MGQYTATSKISLVEFWRTRPEVDCAVDVSAVTMSRESKLDIDVDRNYMCSGGGR